MRIVLCFLIVVLLAYFMSSWINKYSKEIYLFFACIAFISIWHGYLKINSYKVEYVFGLKQFMDIFTSGALGGAIFILVMYMGVFDLNNDFTRRMRKNRGVLSIIGSICLLPHILFYLIYYINNNMITSGNGAMLIYGLILFVSGLIAFIVMLPLFITSFIAVRKRMNSYNWKKLQSYAYVFYAMIFAHVIAVYMLKPVSANRNINLIFYISVFVSYGIFKIIDSRSRRRELKI